AGARRPGAANSLRAAAGAPRLAPRPPPRHAPRGLHRRPAEPTPRRVPEPSQRPPARAPPAPARALPRQPDPPPFRLRQEVRDLLLHDRPLVPLAEREPVPLRVLEARNQRHVPGREPGLLLQLAQRRVQRRLPLVDPALRELPERTLRQLRQDQQEPAPPARAMEDDHSRGLV